MEEKVSLDTIGQGAAVERFNLALQEVFNNIQDPNTSPKVVREVTLKMKIKPDENREIGDVSVEIVSKLASVMPFIVRFFLGRDHKTGKGLATEYRPGPGLFDQVDDVKAESYKDYPMNKEVVKL